MALFVFTPNPNPLDFFRKKLILSNVIYLDYDFYRKFNYKNNDIWIFL